MLYIPTRLGGHLQDHLEVPVVGLETSVRLLEVLMSSPGKALRSASSRLRDISKALRSADEFTW